MAAPVIVTLQRALLRVRRPSLRRGVAGVYFAAARLCVAYLTRGAREASTYLRGGLVAEEFVPGLSDVDLAVVLADKHDADRARARWLHVRPLVGRLVDWPRIYGEVELGSLVGRSTGTFGLDDGTAVYFGPRSSLDATRTLERPGLFGATVDWRLLRGRERRPPEPKRDDHERRIAAWLELVYWWRLVFPFCAERTSPRADDLSRKLVAEAARIWVWLVRGQAAATRDQALRLAEITQERSFDERLRTAVRLSEQIAAWIAAEIEELGTTRVRLVGAEGAGGELPLADWRALAAPDRSDESFVVLDGDAADPDVLAEAIAAHRADSYPALLADGLMVMPAIGFRRTRLRAVKCAVADPVPFALVAGASAASFPNARGWSAEDTAHRAVAEHRARLRATPGADRRDVLRTAARAALFLESVLDGDPELCVSAAEAARRLEPEDARLERRVLELPAYR